MNTAELTKQVIKVLADYLLAEMASITSIDQILEEWPEASLELQNYPVISIITKTTPEFTPHMDPQPFESVVNDEDDKSRDYKYSVGQYDFELQVDLWTDYKARRHTLYQEFFAAFHKKLVTQGYSGVTLVMADYHGCPIHFQMVGYSYTDSEEASQRKEWRVKIDLLANCEAVFEATQKAIVETEQSTEVSDTIKID